MVLTGRLTIPMMKKHGYDASMAGAIEATASSAGQIMPPVLGLAAFIIASFLNRPYIEIALAATIPALLYLVGVAIAVTVYAKRRKLPKLTEKADLQMIARMSPTFLISFGVVLWLLLGYRSPAIAGLYGIVLALGLSLLQGRYRPKWKALYEAVDEGFVLVARSLAASGRHRTARPGHADHQSVRPARLHPAAIFAGLEAAAADRDHVRVAHPRHGAADAGRLHHRGAGAGAVPAADRRAAAGGAFLRLLLRGLLHADPARRRQRAGRRQAGEGVVCEDGHRIR